MVSKHIVISTLTFLSMFSCKVELTREDGLVTAYCFIHLTIHEFLAALRIMTSTDVSDTELKKR